jgi:hypothetical protein
VRLRRQQVQWEALPALLVRTVEVVDGEREAARVAADFVQRRQALVAVERRVLDPFRHHRAGRLLEPRHELVEPALLEQEDAAELAVDEAECRPVRVLDPARPRLDVRPIDAQ